MLYALITKLIFEYITNNDDPPGTLIAMRNRLVDAHSSEDCPVYGGTILTDESDHCTLCGCLVPQE